MDLDRMERALRNADAAGDTEAARTIAAAIQQARQQPKAGAAERFGAGLADPIHGGAQLLTKVLPDGVVSAGNRLNNWLADKTGLVAKLPEGGVDQQVRERERDLKARGPEGFDWMRLAGNVLNPVNIAPGSLATRATSLGGRMAAGAGGGAAAASLAPVTQGDDFVSEKAQQIGTGALFGGVTPAVTAGLGRLVSPNASTNTQLAALRAEGVRPTIGQTLGGFANRIEEKAVSVPFLGDAIAKARTRAAEDLNRAVANRALAPLGEAVPEDKLGRDLVQHVQSRLSGAYEKLLPKLTFRADDDFAAQVGSLKQMVETGAIKPDAVASFNRVLQNEVLGKLQGQNAMTGQTFKAVESNLGQQISRLQGSTDSDQRLLADALKELRSAMRAALERSNPNAAELKAINRGWANFKPLERAASYVGADDGVFSPSQLQSAVKALDRSKDKGRFARGQANLQDLSDAARSTLGPNVPNSGTADRLMQAGALGSAVVNPAIPLSLFAGAGLYTAPAQSLLRGSVTARPQSAQAVRGLLNQTSPMLAPTGGLLALYGLE
ncbi:MAG: hypothetical protein ACK52I_37445 [Pseudomonadota bacterium]